jgi:hypothetical protein
VPGGCYCHWVAVLAYRLVLNGGSPLRAAAIYGAVRCWLAAACWFTKFWFCQLLVLMGLFSGLVHLVLWWFAAAVRRGCAFILTLYLWFNTVALRIRCCRLLIVADGCRVYVITALYHPSTGSRWCVRCLPPSITFADGRFVAVAGYAFWDARFAVTACDTFTHVLADLSLRWLPLPLVGWIRAVYGCLRLVGCLVNITLHLTRFWDGLVFLVGSGWLVSFQVLIVRCC